MALGNYSQDDTEYFLGISDYNFSTVFFVLKKLTNNVQNSAEFLFASFLKDYSEILGDSE